MSDRLLFFYQLSQLPEMGRIIPASFLGKSRFVGVNPYNKVRPAPDCQPDLVSGNFFVVRKATYPEKEMNTRVKDDFVTIWMILLAMAVTAGVLLWLLRT